MDGGRSVPATQAEKVAATRYVSKLDDSPGEQSSQSQKRTIGLGDVSSPSQATGSSAAVKQSHSTLAGTTTAKVVRRRGGSKGARDDQARIPDIARKLPQEGQQTASEYSSMGWGLLERSTNPSSEDSADSE